MPTYRVTLTTVLEFSVEIEDEDSELAIEKAHEMAPREVYGTTFEQTAALAVNETWDLRDAEAKEIASDTTEEN